MKIVTKKQMKLDELIKYVWENDHKNREYYSENRVPVDFTNNGHFSTEFLIDKDEVFPVEVEEELSEDTVFDELWKLWYSPEVGVMETDIMETDKYWNGVTIKHILSESHPHSRPMAIYHKDTLIWSKDTGIPSEGTLEL